MPGKINRFLEKIMPFSIPLSLVAGILFTEALIDFRPLIPWVFAFMTFAGSLNSNFKSVQKVIAHPLPIIVLLILIHIIMPVVAWSVGHLTYADDTLTITGFVLAFAIPTGVTSFIWTVIYKGNTTLGLTLILVSTILSPILVPLTMSVLVGQQVEMDALGIMKGLFLMVVLPSLAGMTLNQLTKGKIVQTLGYRIAPLSKVGMIIVILLNGAVVAPYVKEAGSALITLAIIVFLLALFGYSLVFATSLLFKFDRETIISMTYMGGMRNVSAGTVLAITYFPAPVALPVVLCMLYQQILASLFGIFMAIFFRKVNLKERSTIQPSVE